jgi:ubiquinone/menaquinone biosynthesis C-methylase UbiE
MVRCTVSRDALEQITRVSRPRAAAAATYDRLAPWYDLLTIPERPIRQRAVALLAPQSGERVLVIGSGTGRGLAAIARTGASAVGVDIAPAMCRRASARLEQEGLGRAAPICADALHLPLSDAAHDAALVVFTLELFDTPEMPLVLREIARELRPDGRLVVACLSRRRVNLLVRLYEWLHNRWPRQLDCRPILAAPLLEAEGWDLVQTQRTSLCGLPVDLVLARPPKCVGDTS